MATFFNRATLSYNDVTTTSNTVTGEIVGSLTVNKTVIPESYATGDTLTYVVNVINNGTSPFTGLTFTDDLGAYDDATVTRVPLTYEDGSLSLFINGIPSPVGTVVGTPSPSVTGLTVPASGVLTIVYRATVNEFAPLSGGSSVINTATLTSPILGTVGQATAAASPSSSPQLSIEKALSPTSISPNGQITYTFTITNTGLSAAVATDNVTLSDTFDPILSGITVSYNGAPLSSPDGYTYNETTGEFSTVPGVITVPAATAERDPDTGAWIVTPGVTTVTVTGTI